MKTLPRDELDQIQQNYVKVTVRQGGATHVAAIQSEPGDKTLCGRKWWFTCDLGTDYYCQHCQVRLGRVLYGDNLATPPTPSTASPD